MTIQTLYYDYKLYELKYQIIKGDEESTTDEISRAYFEMSNKLIALIYEVATICNCTNKVASKMIQSDKFVEIMGKKVIA